MVQNYYIEPNPFTSITTIRYYTPEGAMNSKILIRNTEGKKMGDFAILYNGHGSITLNAGTLAAGTYYYSLIVEGKTVETKKMIIY